MSPAKKRSMVQRDHPKLSISRQCKLVNLSRPGFYYTPVGLDATTLSVMNAIDCVFTNTRFSGTAKLFAGYRHVGSATLLR